MLRSDKQPLVSVLLSIYKVEKYLEECLDSILAQSYKNLEIVCVNNGSPDKCGEILERYAKKDKRIKVITLKENRMLCGGRNAGLDNATGEFICFVDPDDWIEENNIKSMVNAIINQRDENGKFYNLVVSFAAQNFSSNGPFYYFERVGGNCNCEVTIEDYNKENTLDTHVPMWNRLYRRDFLNKTQVRFLDGFQTDNIPFTMKLMSQMKSWYLIDRTSCPKSCYWRRMEKPEGVLTEKVLFKNMEIAYCLENLYDYLKENKLAQDLRVPFHLFFVLCFPRHEDMPRYYQKFKNLMIKMEDDIKSAPDTVYQQCDRDLCNLLIYTSDYFQFVDLYFRRTASYGNYTLKLFNFIPLFKKKNKGNKVKYYFLGLPVWKTKFKGNTQKGYLFSIIPLLKRICK